jgi:apolipoprotein N-acyltransferase
LWQIFPSRKQVPTFTTAPTNKPASDCVNVNVGPPSKPADRYPYNTALMMDAGGSITGSDDKVFLMLFGEYIPFYDTIPWFTKLFPEASNFSRGREPASFPLRAGGRDYKLGPLICYEDILPGSRGGRPSWARTRS